MSNCSLKSQPSESIFIFAGEASGDLYGARLIEQLKKIYPQASFFGVGGNKLQNAGLEIIYPLERFSVMGFSDVLKALPRLIKSLFYLRKLIISRQPKLCLFIDQPDFSLRLAKLLRQKKFSGKIVQFVAPTVWAYKKQRATLFAKHFDLLLTLFSFEPAYFAHTQLKTVWVGHPLVEVIEQHREKTHITEEKNKNLLSIFPGSRPGEIQRNLPIQLEAACLFCNHLKNTKWEIAISESNPAFQADYCKIIENARQKSLFQGPITLVPFDKRYELMRSSSFALAKSGTVTLELALFGCPTLVSYELSFLNRFIATHLLKVDLPFYCIVNILKKKEIFHEMIKEKITPTAIFKKLLQLEFDVEKKETLKRECKELFSLLQGEKKPTIAACEAIAQLCGNL